MANRPPAILQSDWSVNIINLRTMFLRATFELRKNAARDLSTLGVSITTADVA